MFFSGSIRKLQLYNIKGGYDMIKVKDIKNRIELIILIFGDVKVKEVIQILHS